MRLLVADDEPGVLNAYRAVFGALQSDHGPQDDAEGDALFGDSGASRTPSRQGPAPQIDYVTQGLDAATAVEAALRDNRPYSVVFLDMRMPPGIDGKETARRIRALDPDVHIVMVTGFTDHSPQSVAQVAPPVEKLFYLAKPFDASEILQLAEALDARWRQDAELAAARAELRRQMAEMEILNVELAASEARARQAALRDPLTGVANRIAFVGELARILAEPETPVGVLFVDLDRFKSINDTIGHHAADELVRTICRSIEHALPPGAMLARMGGDEFAVLAATSSPDELGEIAGKVVEICARPYGVLGNMVQPSASVGVAWRQGVECSAPELLRHADLALYAAKRDGRSCWRLYTEALDETAKVRGMIEQGLLQALKNDELHLLYQPIVRQSDGAIAGFEALVRWQREDGEVIPPGAFSPVAEESNLIHQIGDWVIRRAMTDCATWNGPYVSINLSPRQFRRLNLVESLVDEARRAGVEPGRVQLEITETSLFENMASAAEVLEKLRKEGFKVALDDFGTGYASLVYLRNFEIDCIKIDGTFVADVGDRPQSPAIVNAIAHLARTLGMSVVAEGVEDVFQQQAMRMAGCGYLQGYYLGRPMDVASATALLSVDVVRTAGDPTTTTSNGRQAAG